jgi:hypothetical protein
LRVGLGRMVWPSSASTKKALAERERVAIIVAIDQHAEAAFGHREFFLNSSAFAKQAVGNA